MCSISVSLHRSDCSVTGPLPPGCVSPMWSARRQTRCRKPSAAPRSRPHMPQSCCRRLKLSIQLCGRSRDFLSKLPSRLCRLRRLVIADGPHLCSCSQALQAAADEHGKQLSLQLCPSVSHRSQFPEMTAFSGIHVSTSKITAVPNFRFVLDQHLLLLFLWAFPLRGLYSQSASSV